MIACGPDSERHRGINRFVDAGYDHVYVHQVGPDQDGFCLHRARGLALVQHHQREVLSEVGVGLATGRPGYKPFMTERGYADGRPTLVFFSSKRSGPARRMASLIAGGTSRRRIAYAWSRSTPTRTSR